MSLALKCVVWRWSTVQGGGVLDPGVPPERVSWGLPSTGVLMPGESEHAEPGHVGSGSQHREVGVDLELSADWGSSSAVSVAHRVADLGFHLWERDSVVGPPGRAPWLVRGRPPDKFRFGQADLDDLPRLSGRSLCPRTCLS